MTAKRTFTDQIGEEITLPFPPKRVICLVPSITEYLIELGVSLVGRTKFCIHPAEAVKSVPIVGGTKKFRFETIDQLKPDLIIGNKEENYLEGIEKLKAKYPVWISDIVTLEDAKEMMLSLGELTGLPAAAANLQYRVSSKLDSIRDCSKGKKVLYLIWRKPWMAVGKATYIDSMLRWMGYENVVDQERYPELSEHHVSQLQPGTIMLSSEPYPFTETHFSEIAVQFPKANIRLVDGEYYSWYGTRILHVV